MLKNRKKIISLIMAIILVFTIAFLVRGNTFKNSTKKLINVNNLSEKYMKNYFSEIKKISKENLDHTLIVISKYKIKDGYGAKKIISAPNNQYYLIFDDENKMNTAKDKLKRKRGVLSVDKNHKLKSFADKKTVKAGPHYSWGIDKMELDPLITEANHLSNTSDVRVAIIDSGLDMNLFKKYFSSGKIAETYSVIDDEGMFDSNGHGTHIAGTIAEGTPDNVKIVPIKQTDSDYIDEVLSIAAINWVTYNNKADVINMSFGSEEYSEALFQAIEAAYIENIIPVAAAGNYNTTIPCYPAAFSNTISVGSVDVDFQLSFYSNLGETIDYVAPGENIQSIMSSDAAIAQQNILEDEYDEDDDFETISGTSMATPHIVDVVALFKSMNSELDMDGVRWLLNHYAIDLGEQGKDAFFGNGFVNFTNANLCSPNVDCDIYNVFKEDDTPRILEYDFGDDVYESLYNYGNNTNLMNMEVLLYYSDSEFIVKDLGQMDATITGYNPNVEGLQTITINGVEKQVNNHNTPGYTYVEEADGTITLDEMEDTYNYPRYIDLPATYYGHEVSGFSSNLFSGNDEIKRVKIIPEIEIIESGSFSDCTSLYSVILPDSLKEIERSAFYNTASLININLPEGLETIGESAFDSSGLTSVTIPGTVKTIQEATFNYCEGLRNVILNEGVERIEAGVFENDYSLYSITIPKTVTEIEYRAFGNTQSLSDINIDSQNAKFENPTDSNTIVKKANNTLVFANEKSTIPSSVKTIGPYSLTGNRIILPDTVTTLKDNSLYYVGYIIIPTSVQNIESAEVFYRDDPWDYGNFVYSDSYAENWLDDFDTELENEGYDNDVLEEMYIHYYLIDSERAVINANKHNYNAFDTVDVSNENFGISLEFSGTQEFSYSQITFDEIVSGIKCYEIVYQHGTDYFRGDDEYYTVVFDSKITGKHFEEKVNVSINKLNPEYTVPTNLKGNLGSKLSTVKLPSGFIWMDGNQKMNNLGTYTYKARFVPSDSYNYNAVDNIDIRVNVIQGKTIITPVIVLTNKTYDGTANIPMSNIRITNLNSDEYTIVSATSAAVNAGQTTATIKIRLSDSKFANYSFEDGKQEEDYLVYFEILKAPLNVTDSTEDKTVDYDGNQHSITVHADYPSNAQLRYMDSNGSYTLTNPPKYTEAGIYAIKYRISIDSNYETYYGEKTLIIDDGSTYLIDFYTVDEDNRLIGKIMVNTSVDTFTSHIILGNNYTVEVDYKVVNDKHLLYTGGKTKIYKNSNLICEYTNVVVGDVSGDAKINSADILLMRQHMLGINTLSGAKYSAANINYDNNVNSADLLRIRQHLLGLLPIS